MAVARFPMLLCDYQEYAIPVRGRLFANNRELGEDDAQNVLEHMKSPKLIIDAVITHSGKMINRRVYPGQQMRASVGTLLTNFGKPITDSHPARGLLAASAAEPKVLGRITEASYFQTVTDAHWQNDWKRPAVAQDSEGSGGIRVKASITDRDAIQEIVDGRMLTLSQGHNPKQYFCSICQDDWIATGPCGHEPGKSYKIDTKTQKGEFQAFGVTGFMDYHHVARTPFPADATALIEHFSFQDAMQNVDGFWHTPPSKQQGRLERVTFVDEASGHTAELFFDHVLLDESAAPAATRPEDVQIVAVADLSEALGSQEATVTKEEKQRLAAEKAAAGDDHQDVNGNWTMPDPKDGHTHDLESLDVDRNGMTTKSKGSASPAHQHQIIDGTVQPVSGGEGSEKYVSRHPGSYYFDADGKVSLKLEDETEGEGEEEGTPAEGGEGDPKPEDVPAEAGDEPKPAEGEGEGAAEGESTEEGGEPKAEAVEPDPAEGDAAQVAADATVTVDVPEVPKTVLDTLSSKIDTLESKNDRLETVLATRDKELAAKSKELIDQTAKNRELQADRVLDLMFWLNKPEVREATDEEKVQAVRTEILKRSDDSLRDRAHDLQLELAVGRGSGVLPNPGLDRPSSPVKPLGAAPSGKSGKGSGNGATAKQRALGPLKRQ